MCIVCWRPNNNPRRRVVGYQRYCLHSYKGRHLICIKQYLWRSIGSRDNIPKTQISYPSGYVYTALYDKTLSHRSHREIINSVGNQRPNSKSKPVYCIRSSYCAHAVAFFILCSSLLLYLPCIFWTQLFWKLTHSQYLRK